MLSEASFITRIYEVVECMINFHSFLFLRSLIIHQDPLQRQFNQPAVEATVYTINHFLHALGVITYPCRAFNTEALIIILTIYVLNFAAET